MREQSGTRLGIRPVYKRVDTCAAEFATQDRLHVLHLRGGVRGRADRQEEDHGARRRAEPHRRRASSSTTAACTPRYALREDGFETIMVNCNPETVSTDYDTSDRLYFEPLTLEDVLEIVDKEKPWGVIVQYGGQTPLKLARDLAAAGVPIIGTSADSIDVAEDRERFQKLLIKLKLRQPPNRTARSADEAVQARRGDRLSGGGAAELRARRPRHGDRALARPTSSAT